jgi:branched-subunit amino acid aminotransferase/4-amino-4-deoxychorismate lyase
MLRWNGAGLDAVEDSDVEGRIMVADSWLAVDGAVLAIDLHRDRFLATAEDSERDAARFWDAAISAVPRGGEWFPRVELREGADGATFILRMRRAPARTRSVTLATHLGRDPRVQPRVKGPSLEHLEHLRGEAHGRGADDIVILDPLGHISEGASAAIAWWRGDVLCMPDPEIERVDSVTARALAALATATGTAISWETTTPEELDGHEIWSLNALHGPRIVTEWIDGPSPAEQPGRLGAWRARLDALRRPLPAVEAGFRA